MCRQRKRHIDTEEETRQRQSVVAEALTWLRTPYHLNASVKGAGVDCGTLLIAALHGAGLIPATHLGTYRPDFNLHRATEIYIEWVEKFCTQVERDPLPGDIILYRFGRIVAHGAMVVNWPEIIHAQQAGGCHLADGSQAILATRQHGIYSYWG